MKQKKYKIFYSESKEFKMGRLLPFVLVALIFFFNYFASLFSKIFSINFGSVVVPLFFIFFLLVILLSKKFGQGELIVDGNSLSFVKGGQEMARFPLDNNLIMKSIGTISIGKNSHATKFEARHTNIPPLVFHFAKMLEMVNFSSVVITGGGKFFDKDNKPVEINEMQTQFMADPLGVIFNKEKRDKFSTVVQNYRNQNPNNNLATGDSKANYSIGVDQSNKSNQATTISNTFNQTENKMSEIVRVFVIIVVVVIGYIVLRKYF